MFYIPFLLLFVFLPVFAVQNMNPDLSVVGQFNLSKDPASGNYLPGLGEMELGLTAPIDSYSTATLIFSHSQSAVEIEEAFMKITSLPWDLQARLGRMRTSFNHLNALHTHEMPFIELPKYLQDFFGSEGLVKNGAELSLILPFGFYSELNTVWLTGEADNSFAAQRPITGFKWKNFFELGESSGLELGFSYLQGVNSSGLIPTDNFKTQIQGLNLRYKQGLGPQSYFVFNNEWLWSKRDELGLIQSSGSFSYLGWQLDSNWQLGMGANHSQNPNGSSLYGDVFACVFYKWSEFQTYRFKYTRDDQNNENWLLSVNFILGPHPVHEF